MFKLIDFWSPGKAGSWNSRTGCLGLGGIEQENWDSLLWIDGEQEESESETWRLTLYSN